MSTEYAPPAITISELLDAKKERDLLRTKNAMLRQMLDTEIAGKEMAHRLAEAQTARATANEELNQQLHARISGLVADVSFANERLNKARDLIGTLRNALSEYEAALCDGPENCTYARYEKVSEKAVRAIAATAGQIFDARHGD